MSDPLRDEEKGTPVLASGVDNQTLQGNDRSQSTKSGFLGGISRSLQSFEKTMAYYNLEARGIDRVDPADRHSLKSMGYMQVALFWFSINLAANNVTLGMLGPAAFSLSFTDSSLCAVFGAIIGSLPVAYFATFGPRSGNRSMVVARYSMGWYPAKLVVILNLIVLLGYAMIDAVVAGQILSAVSPGGSMSTIVGIVITAIITWIVTTFGYSIFHYYERYSWVPQVFVLAILAGVAGPKFDLTTPSSGDGSTVVAHRISFLSLCLSAAITYAGGAADYFVYYPEETPKWTVFSMTLAGLTASFTFAFVLGAGLGSAINSNQQWGDAYNISQGALIVQGYAPLGGFGSFCSVIVALGLIANMVVPTYSSSVDFQVLGRWLFRVPRIVWSTVGALIFAVCAIAGRAHLAGIFTNFLALMGYWVAIWVAIFLEEHIIFRRALGLGWDWEAWNDRQRLPVGAAALCAFLVGWAGSILCMSQTWFTGPIAKLVGDSGADLGNYVGFAWGALVYAPLRYLEFKRMNR
ncbi:hypothetical protein ANO11243_014920 [Dothideomycetidae sp. 11243]|nr:hypothetical protein ANO11243_014920 [fungal sp. No.11243]